MSKQHHIGISVCAATLIPGSGEIQLTPAGSFRTRDNRPTKAPHFYIDAATAQKVIDQFVAEGSEGLIDYEHQTVRSESNGQEAPAAGWFTGLEWREGVGLFATGVTWTAKAAAHINAKEYRYISPVLAYASGTGVVQKLFHSALTNYPALLGMAELEALAAATFSDDTTLEEPMNEEMLKLLGLKAGAKDDEIQAAITALTAKLAKTDALTTQVAELTTNVETLTTNLATAQAKTKPGTGTANAPDPAKYVPIEVVTELTTKVADLSARLDGGEVDNLIEAGLGDGRLSKTMEPWARDLGKKDVAALKGYLDKATPIAALSGMQSGDKAPVASEGPNEGLTADEVAMCSSMGVDPKEFKKTKDAEALANA